MEQHLLRQNSPALLSARRWFILVFTAILVPTIIGLGSISTRVQNFPVYIMEIVGSVVLVFNALYTYRSGRVEPGATILVAFGILVGVSIFITGGVADTGYLWLILLPFFIYFLLGLRRGTIWLLVLFLAVLLATFFMLSGFFPSSYSFLALRQFFLVYLFALILAFYYEKSKEDAHTRELRLQEELRELNTDLEMRVQREVEHRRAREQLLIQQSRLAAMGEMIGAIAHQWRQPINALGLLIQDLEDAIDHNELDEQYVRTTVLRSMQQIDYMSGTIDDFRGFFQPSREKAVFDLKEVLQKAASLIMPQLMAHGIILHLELPSNEKDFRAEIKGYRNELKQVLINLINNARLAILSLAENSANEPAKSIQTDAAEMTEMEGLGSITLKLELLDDVYRIQVIDEGGGVPEEVMERIFDPYFTTRPEGQGTGLGLYMSRMIVERNMNGTIYCYNREGGACFVLEFPRDDSSD